MAVRALSTLAVVVLAALLLYSPPQLPSCSIVVTAVFSRAQDFSLEDAAKGQAAQGRTIHVVWWDLRLP